MALALLLPESKLLLLCLEVKDLLDCQVKAFVDPGQSFLGPGPRQVKAPILGQRKALTQVKILIARVQGKSKPGFWASEKLGPRSKPLLTQVKTFMAQVKTFMARGEIMLQVQGKAKALTQGKTFVDPGQNFC